MNHYILIVIGLLFSEVCLGQTNQITRIEIQKRKIKSIKYSTYTCWMQIDSNCKLYSIRQEQYDTLGNLLSRCEESQFIHLSDLDNFKCKYEYDKFGNVILESNQSKYFSGTGRWTYKYDSTDKMIEKTELDTSNKPRYTIFHLYNELGLNIKDSLVRIGAPPINTTYFYTNGRLDRKLTFMFKDGDYKNYSETIYSYNDKSLLIKEELISREAICKRKKSKSTTFYYYDNKGRLIKTKRGDSVIENIYDNKGNKIKILNYLELSTKINGILTPNFQSIEYEYY